MKKNKVEPSDKTNNLLLIVAIIAVVVSIVGAGITYNYLASFRNRLTGFATETGIANLTVEENTAVNFTNDTVNWGSGMVSGGQDAAQFDTSNQSAENMTNGNWTGNHYGLNIENIGNRNVTLEIKSEYNDSTFIGGSSGGGPVFKIKINDSVEQRSCIYNISNSTWFNPNQSGDGELICDYFDYTDGNDELRIDFYVVIPSDAFTGERTNTITATFVGA